MFEETIEDIERTRDEGEEDTEAEEIILISDDEEWISCSVKLMNFFYCKMKFNMNKKWNKLFFVKDILMCLIHFEFQRWNLKVMICHVVKNWFWVHAWFVYNYNNENLLPVTLPKFIN